MKFYIHLPLTLEDNIDEDTLINSVVFNFSLSISLIYTKYCRTSMIK